MYNKIVGEFHHLETMRLPTQTEIFLNNKEPDAGVLALPEQPG